MVGVLDYLTAALMAAWALSEVVITLIGAVNRLRGPAQGGDRFSVYVMSASLELPVILAFLLWRRVILSHGQGGFGALAEPLGYLGCACIMAGIVIRLLAVATLRKQFTTTVSIVSHHELIQTGLYRILRHPSYTGLLAIELGIGLASRNWLGLALAVVLPLAGTLYRMHVEELALLRHFGPAYQAYAARTKRLIPGIY